MFYEKKIPQNKVVNMKALRTKHIGLLVLCLLYYVWIAFLISWPKNISIGKMIPAIPYGNFILIISIIAASLFLHPAKAKWLSYPILVGVCVLTIIFTILLISSSLSGLWIAIGVGVLLGYIHVSLLILFVFTLNNTEKFYTTVLGSIIVQVVMLYKKRFVIEGYLNYVDHLFVMLLLTAIIVMIILLKRYFVATNSKPSCDTKVNSRICLICIFSGIYIAISFGVIRGVVNSGAGIYGNWIFTTYYLGGLAGCLLYVAIYMFCKKPIILVGNVTFGCIALGILCYAFVDLLSVMAIVFSILTGIGCGMGIINVLYIITVVAKKYNSIRYLRLSILWVGAGGGIVSLIINMVLRGINNKGLMIMAALISAVFLLLFMMISPVLTEGIYYNDWVKASEEMDVDIKPCSIYEQYHLSTREIEVIQLLLEGYTLRQISAILSLAYSTINTYCTSAYRKLSINSRIQLLLLFKEHMNKA